MVRRTAYLQQLLSWKDEQVIKVITGIRRCGKSTLLRQYQELLQERGVGEEQIISINFEELEYEPLLEYHALYQYVKERLCPDKMTYDTIIVCGGAFRLRSFFVKAENVCKRMEPPAHHRLPRCRPENSGPETLRRGEAGSCPEPWLGFLRRCLGLFPAATPQGRQVLPCSRHPPDTMRKGRPQRGEFRKGLPEPKAAAIILFAAVCG